MKLSNVITAMSYVGYVSGAVQQIEAANAALPGATKKDLVLTSILAAAKVGETVPETHVALISSLIDLVVGLLNASGVFAKKAK